MAQLHQLRGRVGRGEKQSSCILLYGKAGKIAQRRLEIMRESEDGFYIAEEDMKLRGSGEIIGQRQSGLPNFHFFNLENDEKLLSKAQRDAIQYIANEENRREAIEILLKIFCI